jgi:hypothetical protein
MNTDNRQLKRDYKLTKRAFGIVLIRNTTNDKVFLVSGMDTQGLLNRQRFQLKAGGHPNKKLQKDWNELGEDKFEFEVLDQMEPSEAPGFDARRELNFLEDMWLEKLEPYDDRGYNERKLSREERLKRISASHRQTEDEE